MIDRLKAHIASSLPFLEEKHLLIACSGGVDSVVLCHLMKSLQYSISIAHFNFLLRGDESDADEEFVLNLADKMSVQIFTRKIDTKTYAADKGISIQMAARDLRYNWFEEVLEAHNLDYVLTAHHLDDDLETFFINLSRGTGIKGLSGIPAVNGRVVRPLLNFSKEEIIEYANENGLRWREDSSNSKTDYLRNQIRLDIIPKYKELNKNVLNNFRNSREHLVGSQNLVEDYLVLIKNLVCFESSEGIKIDIQKLEDIPNTNSIIYELLSPYGFTAWDDIIELLNAQSGKMIFSRSHRLVKDRDHLILSEKEGYDDLKDVMITEADKVIDSPIHLKFEEVKTMDDKSSSSIFIDKDKIKYPLKIRTWMDGDSFYPFGMKGKKKLSKFFKDEKLSLLAKEKILVLLSDDQIVWVIGLRPDDRFKVNDNTKKIIKITWID